MVLGELNPIDRLSTLARHKGAPGKSDGNLSADGLGGRDLSRGVKADYKNAHPANGDEMEALRQAEQNVKVGGRTQSVVDDPNVTLQFVHAKVDDPTVRRYGGAYTITDPDPKDSSKFIVTVTYNMTVAKDATFLSFALTLNLVQLIAHEIGGHAVEQLAYYRTPEAQQMTVEQYQERTNKIAVDVENNYRGPGSLQRPSHDLKVLPNDPTPSPFPRLPR